MQNFGIDIRDVGYTSYGAAKASGTLPPMAPCDVYEAFYNVTQIAETGYFKTKGYCFEDFRASHSEYGRLWLEEMMKRAGIDKDYKARSLQERHDAYAKAGRKVEIYRRFLETGELPQDAQSGNAEADETKAVSVAPGDSDSLEDFCRTLVNPEAKAHYEWLLESAPSVSLNQCSHSASSSSSTNVARS